MSAPASPPGATTRTPDSGGRRALVLYGSETGNAQAVAEDLGQLVRRLRFASTVLELDAVEPAKLNHADLVLLAVSTTGQGVLPRNALAFWRRMLQKKLAGTHLAGVRFAIFGLGDSSYPKFNFAALKLRKRLLQLGAQEVASTAEADEQHEEGSDTVFLPWKDKLRARLLELYPLAQGVEPIPDSELLQPPWLLSATSPDSHSVTATKNPVEIRPTGRQKAATRLRVKLTANERVTPDKHWQNVRHFVFEGEVACPYEPGDVLAIYPKNSPQDVEQLIDMLGWRGVAEETVRLVANENYSPIVSGPGPSIHPQSGATQLSIRRILAECVDLNAIPKRSFFSLLAHFTEDEVQKLRLVEFADPQYTDELFDYTTRPRRGLLEVLQEFDTVKLPWQWILEIFPAMRERQFSIASGGRLKRCEDDSVRLELLVAIVKYKTVMRKIRRGVCTHYLEGLETGAFLDVDLIKGSLHITKRDAGTPVLMIGPGTGVAPMRSLIWERAEWNTPLSREPAEGDASLAEPAPGPSLLLFGCRNEDADYFFRDEWPRLRDAAALEVRAAFSRDQQSKVYVQDLIRGMGKSIFELVYERKGIVCVCGSSGRMPQAVRDALVDALHGQTDLERSEMEDYLSVMEKEGRYKQETW